jgi:hypothetical protein
VAVAALLSLVILLTAAATGRAQAAGKFGSRLLIKLAGIFALVGVLPGRADLHRVVPVRVAQHRGLVRRQGPSALDAGLTLGRARSTRW